jgi:adenine-specific DNA-methyltransferase
MEDRRIERARKLRKVMTNAEHRLWFFLRGKRLGAKFQRQRPIGPYIVDFVAQGQKLIVELDGGQHAEAMTAAYDLRRTRALEAQGFKVLRFWNHECMLEIERVLEEIDRCLRERGKLPP